VISRSFIDSLLGLGSEDAVRHPKIDSNKLKSRHTIKIDFVDLDDIIILLYFSQAKLLYNNKILLSHPLR